jgi:predicted Zn-dependent protease
LRATLARTLYEAQRWDEAQGLFEELTAEQPSHPVYNGFLAPLSARRGDRDEAERIGARIPAVDLWRQHPWPGVPASPLSSVKAAVDGARAGMLASENRTH